MIRTFHNNRINNRFEELSRFIISLVYFFAFSINKFNEANHLFCHVVVCFSLGDFWFEIITRNCRWKDIFIHETSVGSSKDNSYWEIPFFSWINILDSMPVSLTSSSASIETIFRTGKCHSWNKIIKCSCTCFVIVCSMLSHDSSTH